MKYTDRVLGDFDIEDKIIIELIHDESLQRLKGIDQAGYGKAYFPNAAHNRFEHSLGVYYILKKYDANLEEQIAGLIHDVSHSVFSHCIDYVLKTGEEHKQNHQDSIFADFVIHTNIPDILKKYGFDLEYILNDTNFSLKERELPDLCADRIDYSLRTAVMYQEINRKDLEWYLEHLMAEDGEWFFKDLNSAKKYAELFFTMNEKYYSGLSSAIMFQTVADCIGYAIQKGYLQKDDLYTTDEAVLAKIRPLLSIDSTLNRLFQKMNNKVAVASNPANYSSKVVCKSRIVDPYFLHHDEKRRLSDVDSTWHNIVFSESQPKEYFLAFEE